MKKILFLTIFSTFLCCEIFAKGNSAFQFAHSNEGKSNMCQLSFAAYASDDSQETVSGNFSLLRTEKNMEYYVSVLLRDGENKLIKIENFYFKTACITPKSEIGDEFIVDYKNKMKRDFDCNSSDNKEISSRESRGGIIKIFSFYDVVLFKNIDEKNKDFKFVVTTPDKRNVAFKLDFSDQKVAEFNNCSGLLIQDHILKNATMEELLQIRKNEIGKK